MLTPRLETGIDLIRNVALQPNSCQLFQQNFNLPGGGSNCADVYVYILNLRARIGKRFLRVNSAS